MRSVGATLCLLAALLVGTPAYAEPAPGAPGIGDPYFPSYGNGGYDVDHYDLRLRYRPETDLLSGTTTILARALEDLSQFNLDFVLPPTSVRVNGLPAVFRQEGTELVVTPARTIAAGSRITVVVTYSASPSEYPVDGWSAWAPTPGGGIIALGEPEVAWWWFPSNDHPADKATFDISIGVPDDYQAISSGRFLGTVDEPGYTRWRWRVAQPTTTYLVFLAIGHYDITTDTTADGLPIVNAYSTSLGEFDGAARASLERTGEVVQFLSDLFGDYPFDALGGVALAGGANFALETQARPVYGPGFFRNGSNLYVVVHELAHQWFGDSVSVATWRNIWLNEGLASYAEWLWSEAVDEGTAQEIFDWYYSVVYPPESDFWQVTPGDPGPDVLFHSAVYDRGAMAVHALRQAVGDEAFFEILRTWVSEEAYGNATIEDFIALAERISGQQLDELFEAWLFTPGRPSLSPAARAVASPTQPESFPLIADTHRLLSIA